MNAGFDEFGLTAEECDIARELWDALMFAPTHIDLQIARRALTKASCPVYHAVITDINAHWLQQYEPSREENPFLPRPLSDSNQIIDEPQADVFFQGRNETSEPIRSETPASSSPMLRIRQWLHKSLISDKPALSLESSLRH